MRLFGSTFSAAERAQMRFLRQTYCQALEVEEDALPKHLQMNEAFDRPLYTPSAQDFDEHAVLRRLQDVEGLLRTSAESIVSVVSAFQSERMARLFGGHENDPTNLLLEELKHWAVHTLAPASCVAAATLRDVLRRREYLLLLQHGQHEHWQSGRHERTMQTTLLDVRASLENRVLPLIRTEIAHSSARDHLRTLEARGTGVLLHGVQLLFYVLRSSARTPADCTIANLRHPHHAGMRTAMASTSGKCLGLLVNTPPFVELFPDDAEDELYAAADPPQAEEQEDEVAAAVARVRSFSTAPPADSYAWAASDTAALFLGPQQQPMVPAELAGAPLAPAHFFTESDSGIVQLPNPAARRHALDTFVGLHGLLHLLATLMVSCRRARQLAGPGGDLLVYGPGGSELRKLMTALKAVLAHVLTRVDALASLGTQMLDRLGRREQQQWRTNFTKVFSLAKYIHNDVAACGPPVQEICANSQPANVQRLVRRFRQATSFWVSDNASVCGSVGELLGVPGLLAAVPPPAPAAIAAAVVEEKEPEEKEPEHEHDHVWYTKALSWVTGDGPGPGGGLAELDTPAASPGPPTGSPRPCSPLSGAERARVVAGMLYLLRQFVEVLPRPFATLARARQVAAVTHAQTVAFMVRCSDGGVADGDLRDVMGVHMSLRAQGAQIGAASARFAPVLDARLRALLARLRAGHMRALRVGLGRVCESIAGAQVAVEELAATHDALLSTCVDLMARGGLAEELAREMHHRATMNHSALIETRKGLGAALQSAGNAQNDLVACEDVMLPPREVEQQLQAIFGHDSVTSLFSLEVGRDSLRPYT